MVSCNLLSDVNYNWRTIRYKEKSVLGKALYWQQISSKLARLSNLKGRILFSVSACVVPFTLVFAPTIAVGETLGVVKSQENIKQWSGITTRLQQVGVNYCIIDASSWQQELDLGNISVLLLPNLETLNGAQATAIERWMNRGGKVVVTGPTGNLAQAQVRSQLRSLFGAYWGFSLSSPASLELSRNTPLEWTGRDQLANTFTGGVVIPAHSSSQIAATWSAEGTPPAAVLTNNSTFLGWRWGFEAVAPISVDTAWLQAALNRYGFSTYGKFSPVSNRQPGACSSNLAPRNESRPFVPNWQIKNSPLPQSELNLNFRRQTQTTIAPGELETMSQEITGLIARFTSTLLTADAHESEIDLSTGKLVEQVLSQKAQGQKSLSEERLVARASLRNQNAHQALREAKDSLKKFLQLSQRRDYTQARIQWLKARRTLWDNYPTERQLAQPEVRAVWLDRGTIVKARSESDLAKIFDRLANAGINTVFFETVNAGYTIHPSRVAPQQNPLVRGWDPLAAAVKLAHERGMELHAWVWTFAATNQRHNIILGQPKNDLGPILSRYPDWAITDRQGNKFHYNSGKVFLDPANPGVKLYLSLLLEEIATRYQVDGIHLDYIRYPFQSPNGSKSYGYGIASRQQFRQITGVDPITLTSRSPLWSQWMGFRIRQIDRFVGSVSQNLKQKRPELILSTAVFPMEKRDRLIKIQQNWEEWVRQEWIDMLVPMTYALDTDRLQKLTRPLLEEPDRGTTLLLPGIRLLNLPDVVALDQMQLLRGMPTEGYALFAAENFNSNLEQIFSQTQGSWHLDRSEPLPYRQPFQTIALRYQTLQKEWNFLLGNNQLLMEEMTMKEWGEDADRLAIALQALADEPSVKRFLTAELALSSFRRQFPDWMEQSNIIDSYQVEVWQNRLDTLDRLLSYGEKRVLDNTGSEYSRSR